MRKLILPIAVLASVIGSASAQSFRIFAITGDNKGNLNWNTVREINATDGAVKTTLYNPAVTKSLNYQSFANRNATPTVEPAISAVAATAYDAKNNRLYYTNMRGNTLNYIDLSAKSLTVISNDDAAFNTGDKYKSEASIITRMTFGADGAGYALTNDGEQLIRFTSNGNSQTITNLGRIIDGKGNVSVHNQCTSWGGDMVGDAFGNLYLITMHSSVYKINTQTLVADYIGSIKGLPTEFTTNGAAVNENGELVISGAAYTKSYFTVDISTLQVTGEVKSQEGVFNASDLASSNLLYQAKVSAQPQVIAGTEKVSIYPNPAVGKKFQVKIAATNASDKYSVEVTDIRGKVILQNNTAVGSQLMKVDLPTGTPAGLYFLKVTNTSKQTVYNNKLVVE